MILDELIKLNESLALEDNQRSYDFVPASPTSLQAAGVSAVQLEGLVLRYLLNRGMATGQDIARQVSLPFRVVEPELRRLKSEQLVGHRSASGMNDYLFELSLKGHERAMRSTEVTTYFGAAPVNMQEYAHSVRSQSLRLQCPGPADLKEALGDLSVSEQMLHQVGLAVRDGRGMFIYGPPGNGKTSIAERICKSYGRSIWIPKALNIHGEIVRVYDPVVHREIPWTSSLVADARWVHIERPTIIVGGELTLANLELAQITGSGISEAPVQMKSNCGVLVIDDFGRQQVTPAQLLNRWIVPLEKRVDYHSLPSGKKVQVPFDQMVVFSTNLDPSDLVDEAFLRRIPFKVRSNDPTESQFIELLQRVAAQQGLRWHPDGIQYLLNGYYRNHERAMRFCHARDLLHQVRIVCDYYELTPTITNELLDIAARNYFVE